MLFPGSKTLFVALTKSNKNCNLLTLGGQKKLLKLLYPLSFDSCKRLFNKSKHLLAPDEIGRAHV